MGRLIDDRGQDFVTDEALKADMEEKLADNTSFNITASHFRWIFNSFIQTLQSWKLSNGRNAIRPRYHANAQANGENSIATGTSIAAGKDCFAGGNGSYSDTANSGTPASFAYGNNAYAVGNNGVAFGDHKDGYIKLYLSYYDTPSEGKHRYQATISTDIPWKANKFLFIDSERNFAKMMSINCRQITGYFICNSDTLNSSTLKYKVFDYDYDTENDVYTIIIENETQISEGYYYIPGGASGSQAAAFGTINLALGFNSFVSGSDNISLGKWNEVDGSGNVVLGNMNSVSGQLNKVMARESIVGGYSNTIKYKGNYNSDKIINTSIIGGVKNFIYSDTSLSPFYSGNIVTGCENIVCSTNGSVSGFNNILLGIENHVEGAKNVCIGNASHAQNKNTFAIGNGSTSFGHTSMAFGEYSICGGNGSIDSFTVQYDDTDECFYLLGSSDTISRLSKVGTINYLPVYSNSKLYYKDSDDEFVVNSYVANVVSVLYDSQKSKYKIIFSDSSSLSQEEPITLYYVSNISAYYLSSVFGNNCMSFGYKSTLVGEELIESGTNNIIFGYKGSVSGAYNFGCLYNNDYINGFKNSILSSTGGNILDNSYACSIITGSNNNVSNNSSYVAVIGVNNTVHQINKGIVVGSNIDTNLGDGSYIEDLKAVNTSILYNSDSSRSENKESLIYDKIINVDVSGDTQSATIYEVPEGYHAEIIELCVSYRPSDPSKSCKVQFSALAFNNNNTTTEWETEEKTLSVEESMYSFKEKENYRKVSLSGDIKLNIIEGSDVSTHKARVYVKLMVSPLE